MEENDFSPTFIVGLFKGDTPACTQVKDLEIDPPILAGMCVSMIDYVVSKLSDSKQIEFEEKTLKLFNYMIENRHHYVSKVPLKNKEQ